MLSWVDTSSRRWREAFGARVDGHEEAKKQLFAGLSVDRVQVMTDRDYVAGLSAFFKAGRAGCHGSELRMLNGELRSGLSWARVVVPLIVLAGALWAAGGAVYAQEKGNTEIRVTAYTDIGPNGPSLGEITIGRPVTIAIEVAHPPNTQVVFPGSRISGTKYSSCADRPT